MDVWLLYKMIHINHENVHPLSAPIRRDARQTSGNMFKENENVSSQNTKTKTKPLPSGHAPTFCVGLSRKQIAEEGAPRSCPGQKWIRRVEPKTKRSKRELKREWLRQTCFHRWNLGKLRPCLALLHDVQSTNDSLLKKDKGEEMKPRTRPSRVDGSPSRQYFRNNVSDFIGWQML